MWILDIWLYTFDEWLFYFYPTIKLIRDIIEHFLSKIRKK